MSREIKFRAWDNSIGQMCKVLMLWPGDSGKYGLQYVKADGNLTLSTTAAVEGVKLMQFTGLLDKNGKEIYEGDIVKFYDNWGRYYYVDNATKDDEAMPVGTVRITTYKGVTCKFPPKRFTQFWEDHMTSGERPLKGEWNLSNSEKNWEVIGNIHENPELLK